MLVNRQKRCIGGPTEFELPKVTHWSANGWGLHFVKVEDEKAYREEQASTAQQQMEALKQEILREMRKEVDQMKKDIIEAIRTEMRR